MVNIFCSIVGIIRSIKERKKQETRTFPVSPLIQGNNEVK